MDRQRLRRSICGTLNKISLPLQMAAVLIGYYIIEAISRHSLREAFLFVQERPLVYLYNAGLIFLTTLVVYLVRRRVFVRTLLFIFWMGLGIINGVLLAQRVTPFTGPDLHHRRAEDRQPLPACGGDDDRTHLIGHRPGRARTVVF